MKIFRVGLIGCGTIFPMHAQSLKNVKGARLAAVCDIKEARAKEKADIYNCSYYTDYKEMFDRECLDAVHILTPHYLHMPMVIEAARRRINILVEKPMGMNPVDVKREDA